MKWRHFCPFFKNFLLNKRCFVIRTFIEIRIPDFRLILRKVWIFCFFFASHMPCKKTRRKKHQRMSGKWNMKKGIRLIIKSRKTKTTSSVSPGLAAGLHNTRCRVTQRAVMPSVDAGVSSSVEARAFQARFDSGPVKVLCFAG